MSGKLKLVCIGSGFFSQFHYEAWSRVEEAEVVGICSLDRESANRVADQCGIGAVGQDLEALLEACHPDLIDIISPPATHFEFIQIAARRGIDVICQKPFGQNFAEAKQMIEIARQAGIELIVHENFRFMPWYREIKALLESGACGDVLNAQFNLRPGDGQGKEAYLSRQPYFQKMDKFLVHETAIHFIDVFRFIFGEVDSVFARLRRCNPVIAGEDSGLILFNMKNGVQAVFDGNRLLDHASSNARRTMGTLLVEGTAGTIRLDGSGRIWLRRHGAQEELEAEYSWQDINYSGDCVFNLIRHLVDHLIRGEPIENRACDYLENIRIETAIYHSDAIGQTIDLETFHA